MEEDTNRPANCFKISQPLLVQRPYTHRTKSVFVSVLELLENVAEFLLLPDVKQGQCYASPNFAIGKFGTRGGVLVFATRKDVQLDIPPGCLDKKDQIVHMKLFTDLLGGECDRLAGPVVECGPSGIKSTLLHT